MSTFNNATPKHINWNNTNPKTFIFNNSTVWRAARKVTYYVDTNVKYEEDVMIGNTVLSPTTFTPSKSGWTFLGWREDTTASGDVLSSKIMGDEPITLYAVFKQTVTLTYYNNSTSKSTTNGNKYYNNGNIQNPKFTVSQASKSGWTARGWATGTAGDASVAYSSISNREFSSSTTLYGLYEQSVACNFISYNKTETKYGTRYYNSAGNTKNASVTAPSGASYSGWSWRGWSHNNGTGATLSPRYANGATVPDISATENHYGLYEQTIYLYYNGNGSTSGSVSTQSGTRYYNAYGNTSNPSFTLASNGFSRTDYGFTGWNLGAVGATITLSSNTTAYAQWIRTNYNILKSGTFISGASLTSPTFTNKANSSNSYATYIAGTGIKIKSYSVGSDNYSDVITCINYPIDMTNLNTLSFTISAQEGLDIDGIPYWEQPATLYVGLVTSCNNNANPVLQHGGAKSKGTYTLDVSKLSGTHYIRIKHTDLYDIFINTISDITVKW